jgi:hypothetical protein
MKNNVEETVTETEKSSNLKKWDHVFSMLVRRLPDETFERADVFIFIAENWFLLGNSWMESPLFSFENNVEEDL